MLYPLRNFLVACVTAALVLAPAAAVVTIASADAVYAKNGKGGGNNGGNGRGSENAGNRGKPDHAGNRSGGGSRSRATNRGGRGLLGILRGKPERSASTSRSRTKPVRSGSRRRAPVTEQVKASPVPKARPEKRRGPAVQSELKWMNSANASLTAYANAAPNSRVGEMAAYREALLDYQAAADDPEYQEEIAGYLDSLGEFAADGTTEEELQAALAEIQALDAAGDDVDPDALDEILTGLNPDATDEEIEQLAAELEAAIASDNELVELAESRDTALETAADGIELEPGSAAWDHFHDLLKLDEELPEANGAKADDADPEVDDVQEDEDLVLIVD